MSPQLQLRAGPAEAVVDPAAGGRITSLRVEGLELLLPFEGVPLVGGLYPMVPWAGRLRDGVLRWQGEAHRFPAHVTPPHAIHGTLLESPWEVVTTAPAEALLAADLVAPWPFGGRVTHRLCIEPDALRARLRVEAGNAPMPVIAGWHPWFARALRDAAGRTVGSAIAVDLEAGAMLRRGPDGLPDGEQVRPVPPGPWDDCFVEISGDPGVHWPGGLEVRIASDASWWVVYTGHPDGVCVEPQTGPPDGLNTGECAIVRPGEPLVVSMTINWRRLRS